MNLVLTSLLLAGLAAAAEEIHVRVDWPVRTLVDAQREARKSKADVIVLAGTYHLPETLVFTAEDSGTENQTFIPLDCSKQHLHRL